MTALPTWTFRPNWGTDIVERIEWMTAALQSVTGAAQFIAARYHPRRSVEAQFLLTDAERTFLALTLQRMGSATFFVPLWFHRATLTAAASAGATTLACDTLNREFRAGDSALLVGPDAFGGETVTISAVADGSLTLSPGLVGEWPAGTVVHPLREGTLEPSSQTLVTNTVVEGNIRFDFDSGNDLDGGAETFTLYGGVPVLTQRPNWADTLSNDYAWLRDEFDSQVGPRVLADTAGRAFATHRYGLMLQGRAEQMAFRKLLYRLRGSQGAVWMPSHGLDATVAVAASSGSTALEIGRIGLAEVGGVSDDIAHLLVGDDLPIEWTALASPSNPAHEKLTLASALTRDVAVGEKASFLTLARLDQDVVTLTHKTDSDGVATTQLAWTAFDGSRDGSAAGYLAIPEATMTAGSCSDASDVALVLLDFENADYKILDVEKPMLDVAESEDSFDAGDIVAGVGFGSNSTTGAFSFFSAFMLTTESMAALGSDGFTVVVDFTFSSSGTDGSHAAIGSWLLAGVGVGVFGGYRQPPAVPADDGAHFTGGASPGAVIAADPLADGAHRLAATITVDTIAASIDGGTAVEYTGPGEDFSGAGPVDFTLQVAADTGVTVTGIVSKVEFFATVATSGLATMSTLP